MNLKKMIIVNTISAFLLSFLAHFLYEWFPNPVFAIIFPVNESIWEHMKMLYTTLLMSGIIEYFILKKYDIMHNNFLLSVYLKSIISIPMYLLMFLPIYYNIGENMFVAISIMFITILIVNIIEYFILNKNEILLQKIISITLIITTYIIMGILTFKPPKIDLFLDTHEEKYGINNYLIKE